MQAMKFGFRIIFFALLQVLALFLFSCSRETPEQRQARLLREIDESVKTAQTMIFEEKYASAIELLEKALSTYGDNAKIFETLAYAYSADKKFDMAGMYFEKAGDMDSSNPDLYLNAAASYEQAKIYPAAAGAYRKYIDRVPDSSLALKKFAICLEKQDLFEEALNAYFASIKASKRSPTSDEAASIGSLFVKIKNYSQAKRWLEAALGATLPENVKTRSAIYAAMIEMYLNQKDMAALQKAHDELAKINPELLNSNWPDLTKQLADYNQKLKDAQEAIKKANEAKILEEKRLAEEKAKAEAEAEAKRKAEEEKLAAIKASEEVKKQEQMKEISEPVLTPEERVRKDYDENFSKGDFSKAEKIAQGMVAKKPDSAEAWRCLSKSYTAQGKNRDAFYAAREAMRNSPDDVSETLLYLSTAGKILNNETYLDEIYKAKEKFPNNCEIMLGMARTYTVLGNKTEAKYAYEQFFKLADREHPLRQQATEELQKLDSPESLELNGNAEVDFPSEQGQAKEASSSATNSDTAIKGDDETPQTQEGENSEKANEASSETISLSAEKDGAAEAASQNSEVKKNDSALESSKESSESSPEDAAKEDKNTETSK